MRNDIIDKKEYERRISIIQTCGRNRGPHDYIPIAWFGTEEDKQVTHFMCKVCMIRVSMKTLLKHFHEATV